jgi:hypothetical protein
VTDAPRSVRLSVSTSTSRMRRIARPKRRGPDGRDAHQDAAGGEIRTLDASGSVRPAWIEQLVERRVGWSIRWIALIVSPGCAAGYVATHRDPACR